MPFLTKRLKRSSGWRKMFLQRLTEPLHLNLISLYVLIFGSLKKKIAYDLVLRPQHAYGVMHAAEQAKNRA